MPDFVQQEPGELGRGGLGNLRVADATQQDRELVATGPRDVVAGDRGGRQASEHLVAVHHRSQPLGGAPKQPVASGVPECFVDAPETVEIHAQQRRRLAGAPRFLDDQPQVSQESSAARETGESIEVLGVVETLLCLGTSLAQRDCELADLVRVERLLQVEELVRRRDATADLRRVEVRVGRADDDLDLRVDLADPLRGPGPVPAGRHAHVEEHDGERPAGRACLAHGRDRLVCAAAVLGTEPGGRPRPDPRDRGSTAGEEQLGAQVLDRGAHRAGLRIVEHLAVGLDHRRLVIDDEDAHGSLWG